MLNPSVLLCLSLCFVLCDSLWGTQKNVNSHICPDKAGTCPDQSTCCKLSTGKYGCCPLPNAVCCSDHTHCCPNGFTCDVSKGSCNQGNLVIDWLQPLGKEPAPLQTGSPQMVDADLSLNDVICPGGQYHCATGQTCCQNPQGQWGCCPEAKAVCCSDHIHCCPSGYTCDVAHSACLPDPSVQSTDHNLRFVAMEKQVPATRVKAEYECPDKISTCPEHTTCCEMKNGYYGCCQYENAVCCPDMLHCCPHDMQCNTTTGECINQHFTLKFGRPESEKVPRTKTVGSSVDCPDKSSCPAGTTCCEQPDQKYGCCPYPNAKCCPDHLHCCPSDQTCDMAQGECKSATGHPLTSRPLGVKFPSTPSPHGIDPLGSNVICPDQKSKCLGQSTCCEISFQQYGCCNLPNAVCCGDKTHCCPAGYRCNDKQGVCDRVDGGGAALPWILQETATQERETVDSAALRLFGSLICPDGMTTCNDGDTCCKLSTGAYGCCPLPQAVCCSDHIHCCPSGSKCDLQTQKCQQDGGLSVPWFKKRPAFQRQVKVLTDQQCPDKKSSCPDGTTCCKTATGIYGCCPLASAVCCSDNIHCCPAGTTCDVAAGTCVSKRLRSLTVTWERTQPNREMQLQSLGSIICPDQQTYCETGQTCCKLAAGEWGCCPLPSAVCCANSDYCCPNGMRCESSTHMCFTNTEAGGELGEDWTELRQIQILGDVVCPDKKVSCHHDTTCCKLSTGDYGCCPFPAAVCCADGIHCCPTGYTCDAATGSCISTDAGTNSESWMEIKNKSPEMLGDVVCPDKKVSCHHDTTCCKLSTGDYGCCPFPAAVCCADGIHCCPTGNTCDAATGTCSSDATETTAASVPAVTHNVVCPDKVHECLHDQTCCKLAGGSYGCCPLPAAVCCSDGVHCCPGGSQCDVKSGSCIQDNNILTISWTSVKRSNALAVLLRETEGTQVGAVLCPDKSECPWGTTCCVSGTGKYACCSEKNATCCSDKVHCCPSGYTCGKPDGKCVAPGNLLQRVKPVRVPWVKKVPAKPVVSADLTDSPPGCRCDRHETCCQVGKGYGCCRWSQAQCCSDQKTCCPRGYQCSGSGRCTKM